MKLKTRMFAAVLACGLILGTVAFVPAVQAWEPICAQCRYIIFVGHECHDLLPGPGKTECYDQGPGCKTQGDDCNNLTNITS